jgi:hypothetical protein
VIILRRRLGSQAVERNLSRSSEPSPASCSGPPRRPVRERATRSGSVRVLVGVLDPVLMHVRMGVGLAAVLVLVFVLDVVVIVGCVGMDVAVAIVLMLVGMGYGVAVLIGHGAPLVGWLDDG